VRDKQCPPVHLVSRWSYLQLKNVLLLTMLGSVELLLLYPSSCAEEMKC
jgi:hypothetical protein